MTSHFEPGILRDHVLLTSWAVRLQADRLRKRAQNIAANHPGEPEGSILRSEAWMFCVSLGELLKVAELAQRKAPSEAVADACAALIAAVPRGVEFRDLVIHFDTVTAKTERFKPYHLVHGLGVQHLSSIEPPNEVKGLFVEIGAQHIDLDSTESAVNAFVEAVKEW